MRNLIFLLSISLAFYSCKDNDSKNPDGSGSNATHCSDGILNADESCVDCGGSCGSCNNASIMFDGINDFGNFPNIISDMKEGTIEFWVNINEWNESSENGSYILTGNDGSINSNKSQFMAIGIHPNGTPKNELLFGIYAGSGIGWKWAQSKTILEKGKFHHVAGTWGTQGIDLFIDGIHVGHNDYDEGMPNFSHALIGASSRDNSFASFICDEIKLWDTALSATTLRDQMNCPADITDTILIGYWNIEEGSGVTLKDQTINSNNIDLKGASWSTNTPN